MDPLSDVLAQLELSSYRSGGFTLGNDVALQWPVHVGVKCYAISSGHCWLSLAETAPVLFREGDCFLLPRGLPFRLATNPDREPLDFMALRDAWLARGGVLPEDQPPGCFLLGGHFALGGDAFDVLRQALPAVIPLRSESDRAAMRWAIEHMTAELTQPRPGSDIVVQQLARTMLVLALRLHLGEQAAAGKGWLAALTDPQLSAALVAMHRDPGLSWTLQSLAEQVGMSRSVFAERFKARVGTAPMEYLTRWRMILARERLRKSDESVASIAGSLGYDSESAFGKAFKREVACSPRQYAQRELATTTAAA